MRAFVLTYGRLSMLALLMDFLDSQIIGNEVYLEYDLQSVIDSINAVLSNTPD